MHARPSIVVTGHPRAGLSLLEVLVACGILVVGLTSVVALLPAASSRLGQAAQEDRAGVLAANAYAEVVNRGLLSAQLFGSGTAPVVFGKVLQTTGTTAGSGPLVTAMTTSLIDPTRGFLLEDELVYTPPTTADTPNNAFAAGTAGPRSFREAICWGAMLAPAAYPATPGMRATLTIAVFRKEGTTLSGTLQATGTGATLMRYTTGTANGVSDEANRRQFLPGCSSVLALTGTPQWLRVTSSWTNPGPTVSGTENVAGRASFVVLSSNPLASGTMLPIIAFQNIMRVDQYQVTLD